MAGDANRNGNLEKGSLFFLLCPNNAWTALRDLHFKQKRKGDFFYD